MAYRLVFHYQPGDTLLHQWDVRCKLPGLLALSVTLLNMDFPALALLSLVLVSAFEVSRLPMARLAGELKAWGYMLLMIFLLQSMGVQAQEPGAASPEGFALSREGILMGARTCWRLALMLGFAILFTCTTRSRELQNAVLWLLSPFPFLPARRIALMMALTLRFFSLLLDELEDVRQAVRARLGDSRRNPLVRVRSAVFPLLRRSLLRADDMALALAARGYREDIPPPALPKVDRGHLLALLVLVLGLAWLIVTTSYRLS